MDNPTSNQQGNQSNQPAQSKPTDQGQQQPVQPAPAQPSAPAPVNQPSPALPPAPPVASSPAPTPPPAPQTNQPAQAPMTSPKKSNIGLIVALVLVGLLVVLGGGGYFGYRYLAKKVNSAITSTASTDNTSSTSSSDETSTYSKAKDNTPTDSLTIQVNADLKPIFENLYGGAKLDGYLANEGTTTSMSYVIKNKATSADYAKIEQALTEKGYTKKENVTTSDGFVISFTKADVTISITFQSSLPYEFVVGADKASA